MRSFVIKVSKYMYNNEMYRNMNVLTYLSDLWRIIVGKIVVVDARCVILDYYAVQK